MRVGIDGRAFQPGFKGHLGRGIGLYAAELVRAMARIGGVELVIHFDPWRSIDESRVPAGLGRAWYPRGPLGRPLHHHLATQFLVPAALERNGLDLFHFMAMQDAPLRLSGRCVITVHDVILFAMQSAYEGGKRLRYRMIRRLERATVRRASLILTDSEASRDDIVRFLQIDPARIRVATLGVDARFAPCPEAAIDALRARLGLARPYLLYMGGIDVRKNVPRLLDAYARVRARRADPPDLVLAGAIEKEPDFAALRDQARALGLDSALRLVGYVADAGSAGAARGRPCVRLSLVLRGVRVAAAGGDGVRHAGDRQPRVLAPRGAGRWSAARAARRHRRVRSRDRPHPR